MNKYTRYLSFILIIGFSLMPLFFSLPFRIHLDMSWEGAYRLYLGQVPYKDFGMPIGYGFFIFPLLAFYIFGPYPQSPIDKPGNIKHYNHLNI